MINGRMAVPVVALALGLFACSAFIDCGRAISLLLIELAIVCLVVAGAIAAGVGHVDEDKWRRAGWALLSGGLLMLLFLGLVSALQSEEAEIAATLMLPYVLVGGALTTSTRLRASLAQLGQK